MKKIKNHNKIKSNKKISKLIIIKNNHNSNCNKKLMLKIPLKKKIKLIFQI